MHVLQHSLCIVLRNDAERGLHSGIPCVWKVGQDETTFDEVALELEAQQNMQIVGDLIGLNSDERRLHPVDRAIEGFQRHIRKILWERLPQMRKEEPPKTAASANQI